MKEEDIFWVDGFGNELKKEEIDNRWLYNILRFLVNGGGYVDFLDEDKIREIFKEAKARGIKHNFKVKDAICSYHEKLSYYCQYPFDWINFVD